MGCRFFGGYSGCGHNPNEITELTPTWMLPNPNPARYTVLSVQFVDNKPFTIARIKYPDCTNFEGEKVLVLRGRLSAQELQNMGNYDPHFREGGPLARFEPTAEGLKAATACVRGM